MCIITKELINKPGPFNFCLKCDAPIWEEFALGLEHCGGLATNNKFRGVRGLSCKKPQTDIFVDVYIVSNTPSEQDFFNNCVLSHLKESSCINVLSEKKCKRLDKQVYIVEYKYGR
jgi:hypothetical protein